MIFAAVIACTVVGTWAAANSRLDKVVVAPTHQQYAAFDTKRVAP